MKTIAAIIVIKDEEYSIYYCLKSMRRFIDKFYILDNGSSDNTINRIKDAINDFQIDVDLSINSKFLFHDARNFLLNKVEEDWIFVADGDMIFHTNGILDSIQIKELVQGSSEPVVYNFRCINLWGDLEHTVNFDQGGVYTAYHDYLFPNNFDIYYEQINRFEKIQTNLKRVTIKKDIIFHLFDLNPLINRFRRTYWTSWRNDIANSHELKLKYKKLDYYICDKLNIEINDFEKIAIEWWKDNFIDKFIIFKPDDYNNYYPEIIKEMIDKDAKYKLIYLDNNIIGRNDTE